MYCILTSYMYIISTEKECNRVYNDVIHIYVYSTHTCIYINTCTCIMYVPNIHT